MSVVTVEENGALLLIGVNRPDASNLWNVEVIQAVSRAYRRLGDTAHLRVGVVFGHGRMFTAGLDLASVAPLLRSSDPNAVFPEDGYDPFGPAAWQGRLEPAPHRHRGRPSRRLSDVLGRPLPFRPRLARTRAPGDGVRPGGGES